MQNNIMLETTVAELFELLEEERAALIGGHTVRVEELSVDKGRLCTALEAAIEVGLPYRGDQNDIKRLQAALKRNEDLLEGARSGLAMAQARLASIFRKGAEVGVYDERGVRPQLDDLQTQRGKCA